MTIGPLEALLGALALGMSFPAVQTGYGVAKEAAEPYSPFAPLTHPGTFLLLTSLVTWLVYRARATTEPAPGRAASRASGAGFSTKRCPPRCRSSPSS